MHVDRGNQLSGPTMQLLLLPAGPSFCYRYILLGLGAAGAGVGPQDGSIRVRSSRIVGSGSP